MRAAMLVLFLLADVRVEPSTLNLGEIRGGRSVEAAFRVSNSGSNLVEIVDVERSCGCVEPRWSSRSIPPGESATLTLRLRTLGQAEGVRSWPIAIVTRSAGELQKRRVEVTARLRNEISVQPPQVALFVAHSLEQEITLTDHRDRPLTVTSWETKMPGVRIEALDAKPGTSRLKLTVDGSKLPAGRTDHVLHLYSSDREYDHLEIPVTLVRVEKPRATWSPESPEIVVAAGQSRGAVLVRVRGNLGSISAIEGDDGLSCRWQTEADETFLRVMLDRSQFTGRGVQSAVRIRTANDTIAIPIIVRIE